MNSRLPSELQIDRPEFVGEIGHRRSLSRDQTPRDHLHVLFSYLRIDVIRLPSRDHQTAFPSPPAIGFSKEASSRANPSSGITE